MTAILCLDLGGTGTRGALYDAAGTPLARAEGPAGAVSLGVEATLAAIAAVRGQMPDLPGPSQTRIVLGLAGIGLRDRVTALQERLSDHQAVQIVGDGYGALVDATGGRPGALIAVGTGVAAMRLFPDGMSRTASGWGFPAGDLGSGAWIGLQTVAALTRTLDGATGPGALSPGRAAAVMEITGPTAPTIMDWHTRGRARDFARLAPLILTHASAGEAFAAALCRAAAAELGGVADSLWDGEPGGVMVSGGLARGLLPWLREVAPGRVWELAEVDPLRGLCLMARGLAPAERLGPRPGLGRADYD
ncbi:MAG: hypothetical protein JJT81_05075 [Rubellimicrobium sp.]|nr:hypothetical protein [Rubellimicrobium sp.]